MRRYKAYKARRKKGKVKTRMVFNDVKITPSTEVTLAVDGNEKAKMVFNSIEVTSATEVKMVPDKGKDMDFSRAR